MLLGLALLPVLEWLFPPVTPGIAPAGAGRRRRALPALVAAPLTVVFVVTGLVVDRFDAVHPEPTQLMYALDTDTGQARWASAETSPVAWTRRYITGTGRLGDAFPPLGDGVVGVGPAPATDLPAPALTVGSDTTSGDQRRLTLNLRPQRSARLAYLRFDDADVVSATVDGRPVPTAMLGRSFGVLFHAVPADGLSVSVVLARTGPVKVRVMDGSDGLTGLPGFVARPPGVGVRGSHNSELVVVAKTYTI